MPQQTAILLGVAIIGVIVLSKVLEQQSFRTGALLGAAPSTLGMEATERAYWERRGALLGAAPRHYHHSH